MSKYPKINDPNFNEKVTQVFKKYKIIKVPSTLKEVCYPEKYTIQPHQKLASAFINPDTPYKGVLLDYGIGSGKTCASIQIAEQWKKKYRIMAVLPASLKGNYYNELRSMCTGEEYITNKEREQLKKLHPGSKEYKAIIEKTEERIHKYYDIYSYNKFITLIDEDVISLDKTVLIIDEVQNMVSEYGSYYHKLYEFVKAAPDNARIVLLSATPVYDKPSELALTLNLLPLPKLIPSGHEFYRKYVKTRKNPDTGKITYKVKNTTHLKKLCKGFVSYYRGAPPLSYPEKRIHYVKCKMGDFQFKSYLAIAADLFKNKKADRQIEKTIHAFKNGDIFNLPQSFFLGMRLISNIAYPNKGIKEDGYESFIGDKLSMANLKEYSVKFYKIIRSVKRCQGTVFIYSNFKEYGGLKPLIRALEHQGFKNYHTHGEGPKRFALWTGDEKLEYREHMKTIFNSADNVDGSRIKIVLGSSAVREGVSFLRVKEAHILEPYWNMSRMEQIMGRVVRFCSHRDIPKSEQYVDIYIYIATHPEEPNTIDYHILNMALRKQEINSKFERALKEVAMDCELFYKANNDSDDPNPLMCDK
jgi:superfamily II DNA or RNA helicase